jgi:hypothetical protein
MILTVDELVRRLNRDALADGVYRWSAQIDHPPGIDHRTAILLEISPLFVLIPTIQSPATIDMQYPPPGDLVDSVGARHALGALLDGLAADVAGRARPDPNPPPNSLPGGQTRP